jgi:hypothetical protein
MRFRLGHIDEKALENMSYVLRISENIRMKSDNEGDSEIAKCFPYFYWVLRDFSLDLKGMTERLLFLYSVSIYKTLSSQSAVMRKTPKIKSAPKFANCLPTVAAIVFPGPSMMRINLHTLKI